MAELSPDEKLMDLQAQLRGCEVFGTAIIRCPYCGGANDFSPNEDDAAPELCCEKFALAMCAVVARAEVDENIDLATRALDKADGRAVFN